MSSLIHISKRERLSRWLDTRGAGGKILVLALLLRTVLAFLLRGVPLEGDAWEYFLMAGDMAEGKPFQVYWPPGLPLYEAIYIFFFGASQFVVRLAMLFWFWLLCRWSSDLLLRLHSRRAANIALIFLGFYPAFVYQSVEPLSYLPAAALLLGCFNYVLRYVDEKRWSYLFRIGFFLGLLVLFRPSAGLFVLVIPVIIFIRSRKVAAAGLVATLAAGLIFMWVWSASSMKSRFVPINDANSYNLYLGNNEWTPDYKTWFYGSHWSGVAGDNQGLWKTLREIEALEPEAKAERFTREALQYIGQKPHVFLLRAVNRARTLLAFDSFTGGRIAGGEAAGSKFFGYSVLAIDALFWCLVVTFALFFFFFSPSYDLQKKTTRLLIAFMLIYALPFLISFSHPTYHMPMVPLLLLPASVFVSGYLQGKVKIDGAALRKKWKFLVLLLIFLAIQIEWIVQMF